MKRREFLSGGIAAAGGLIAMPTLSAAVGATRPSNPFSVNVISLDCGAEKPFSVFHITDTHLKAVAETDSEEVRRHVAKRFVGYDPEDALVASIAYARRRHIEYLLHTGDLIDCATDGNIALLKKYFGENGNACVIADIHKLRSMMQEKYPDLKYLMLGHSMGSFLVRQYITEPGGSCEYSKGLAGVVVMAVTS